jgi:GT2 family glycosyltransferase/predicted flap endonuclease-1-like 5' DNA nuclease
MFKYSWLSGQVSGNTDHKMVDYRSKHPWSKDEKHPFASMATPKRFSHPVRQYDEPLISVIIPVGPGHEENVIDALDSLDAQTFRDWEVIVVWDTNHHGQDENLTNKPEFEYLKKAYPHVRWVYTAFAGDDPPYVYGQGAGYARNRGAEVARAPLLLFLDADDWLYDNALELMYEEWQRDPNIIYTDYVGKSYIDEEFAAELGDRLLYYEPDTQLAITAYKSARYNCDRAQSQPVIDSNGYVYVWCLISALVPKEWHDEIGGFDEKMQSWEDWDYWIRMSHAGKCFTHLEEQLLVYRFYTGSRRNLGLQAHPDLLQYLQDKYTGANIMACNCKEKQVQTHPTVKQSPVQAERSETVSDLRDEDFILCDYGSPNRGSHHRYGPTTGHYYGYVKGGDTFLVHKEDVKYSPHLFVPVQQEKAPPPQAQQAPPPPPPVVTTEPPKPETTATAPPPDLGVSVTESTQVEDTVTTEPVFDLQTIPGVTPMIAQTLNAMGVHSLDDLAGKSADDLIAIHNVGPSRAHRMIAWAKEQLDAEASEVAVSGISDMESNQSIS